MCYHLIIVSVVQMHAGFVLHNSRGRVRTVIHVLLRCHLGIWHLRRHFHTNKLRPYIARVSNVGVVNDSNVDFGFVSTAETSMDDELKLG